MSEKLKNKYITIKELAKEVDITTQAIYQRLDKDLKKYLQVIDGKKMIDKKAIKEIFNKNIIEENKNNCKSVDKYFASELQRDDIKLQNELQSNNQNLQSGLQVKTSDLQMLLETLSKQLEEKDKQIKNLQDELNSQNEHARQQSVKLVGLLEQVNELQRNNQVLLAQKDIKNKEIEEQKENKGMFSWLFKKSNN